VIAGRKDPKGLKSGQVLVDNAIVTSDLRLCSAYVVQVRRQNSLWLFKAEDPTLCMFCKIPLFVKHFLLDCPGLNASRRLFYEVTSLKDLFNEIMPEKVLDFLSYVNLKNK